MSESFDVIVAGASLAGSSCALQLGRAGLRTALIDKADFPRRKACGEGLSLPGLQVLQRLGLGEALAALPHASVSGFTIRRRGRQHRLPQPHGETMVFGIERMQLDQLLFSAAAACPSVSVLSRTAVKSLHQDERGVTISHAGGRLQAPFAVMAAGALSVRCLMPEVPFSRRPGSRVGCSQPFNVLAGTMPNDVTIFIEDGYEVYCTPLGGTRINVAYLGEGSRIAELRHKKSMEQLSTEYLGRLDIRGEPCDKLLGAGSVGQAYRPGFKGRVLLAGDACESFDPIGGMGMSHALICGELAADALIGVCQRRAAPARAFAAYDRKRRSAASALRGFTRLTYLTLIQQHGDTALELVKLLRRRIDFEKALSRPFSLSKTMLQAVGTLG